MSGAKGERGRWELWWCIGVGGRLLVHFLACTGGFGASILARGRCGFLWGVVESVASDLVKKNATLARIIMCGWERRVELEGCPNIVPGRPDLGRKPPETRSRQPGAKSGELVPPRHSLEGHTPSCRHAHNLRARSGLAPPPPPHARREARVSALDPSLHAPISEMCTPWVSTDS
eukprot:gene15757-biopygen5216